MVCSQIWLNLLVDDHQFGSTKKIGGEGARIIRNLFDIQYRKHLTTNKIDISWKK
jgi:hypothetical protein